MPSESAQLTPHGPVATELLRIWVVLWVRRFHLASPTSWERLRLLAHSAHYGRRFGCVPVYGKCSVIRKRLPPDKYRARPLKSRVRDAVHLIMKAQMGWGEIGQLFLARFMVGKLFDDPELLKVKECAGHLKFSPVKDVGGYVDFWGPSGVTFVGGRSSV